MYKPTQPKVVVSHHFGINEVNIHPISKKPHRIIVNIAPLPRYNVYFDGKKYGRVIPNHGPIAIDVPANTKHVKVKYEDPLFRLGVGLSLSTILTLSLIFIVFKKVIPSIR